MSRDLCRQIAAYDVRCRERVRMPSRSNLVAHLVAGFQSKSSLNVSRILIILVAIFMVMTSAEPAYAEICVRC